MVNNVEFHNNNSPTAIGADIKFTGKWLNRRTTHPNTELECIIGCNLLPRTGFYELVILRHCV